MTTPVMTKPMVPTYRLYGDKSREQPDFWLHCETISSRSSLHQFEIRLHRHESLFQILYISVGEGDVVFYGERHVIRPPALIAVPPGVHHGFRFSRDVDGCVISVPLSHLRAMPGDRSRLGPWLAAPQLMHLDAGDTDCFFVRTALDRLSQEFEAARSGRTELLDAYLIAVLHLAARLSARDGPVASSVVGQRMERLDLLIRQNLRAHRPAAFYADELGLSATHLNRIVRQATGLALHALIARKMTEEAKRALLFTIASAQEIAEGLGFSDPAYFSRFFRRQTGQTPGAWRLAERERLGM